MSQVIFDRFVSLAEMAASGIFGKKTNAHLRIVARLQNQPIAVARRVGKTARRRLSLTQQKNQPVDLMQEARQAYR